ncbi:MAG: hypothetical protein H6696_15410 [Deferribacteres bacterium]|nr:hypothetical protein [candidate division KSB1 bacterium]MCB9503316.1 hypothetical protein [Deferribacteres bacterium]
MKQAYAIYLLVSLLVLIACSEKNPVNHEENFAVPTDEEMPKILYTGTDDYARSMNFDIEIEKGVVFYRQISYEDMEHPIEHKIALPVALWEGLKATTNLEQLHRVTMPLSCGNFMEYITLVDESGETGFGYALGAPLENIKMQVSGATDSVLGFVHQLRIIDDYCYKKISK